MGVTSGDDGATEDVWVPLGHAFSHALAVAEVRIGVLHPRGRPIDANPGARRWLPTTEELLRYLRENAEVEVNAPRGKWGKEDRPETHLLPLNKIAATRAHLDLMHLLRDGVITARGRWSGIPLLPNDDCPSVVEEVRPVAPGFWEVGWTKKGRPTGPIPSYPSGDYMSFFSDNSAGFLGTICNIEVKLGDVIKGLGHVPQEDELPLVEGGVFSLRGDHWLVDCGGVAARIPAMMGMSYLATLLAKPGQGFTRRAVVETGELVATGHDPATTYRDAVMPGWEDSGDWDADEGWNDPRVVYETTEDLSTESSSIATEMRQLEKEIDQYSSMLRKLKSQLNKAPEGRKNKIEEDIEGVGIILRKYRNNLRRSKDVDAKYRQRFWHALDDAFRYLSMRCPPFVRHMGTGRADERRALVVENGRVRYEPSKLPDGRYPRWDTKPGERARSARP